MGETRKLAAILVADVVGYRRLVGADESVTLPHLWGPFTKGTAYDHLPSRTRVPVVKARTSDRYYRRT